MNVETTQLHLIYSLFKRGNTNCVIWCAPCISLSPSVMPLRRDTLCYAPFGFPFNGGSFLFFFLFLSQQHSLHPPTCCHFNTFLGFVTHTVFTKHLFSISHCVTFLCSLSLSFGICHEHFHAVSMNE